MYLGVIVLLMLVLPLLSVAALPASSPAAFLSFPRKRESNPCTALPRPFLGKSSGETKYC